MAHSKATTGPATATTGEWKAAPEFTKPATKPEEFSNFEKLTSGLVNVPKEAVDEKRQTA